jgi:phosphomannomutase
MGTDPDADRVGVCIKHKGEWQTINGNQMGCILAHYILTNKHVQPHSYIATTFVSTNLIKKICKKYCIDLYVTKTGFKWIGKLIDKLGSKHHYLLGFEESVGALPYTNTRDKDSFTSSALILEINFMCKKMNIDLIDYLNKYIYDVFGYCYTSTNTITINGVNWQSKVVKLINKLKQVNINMIGNYKILSKKYRKEYDVLEWKLTNNSWIKFRMSGTEPKIKTYLNLYINNDKDSQSIIDEVMSRLESIMK